MTPTTKIGGVWLVAASLVSSVAPEELLASIPDPNNILVTVPFSPVQNQIREYTRSGVLVQSIAVPWPSGNRPGAEMARDLVMMDDGRLAVVNGTFTPYLSILDFASNTWTHMTYPGWSIVNSTRFGGATAKGRYLFVDDMSTSGNEQSGTIRFDTLSGTANRFETLFGTHDVNVGLDGKLYTLGEGGSPDERVRVYDPVTLAIQGTVTINTEIYVGIAADQSGNMYLSGFGGSIFEYAPNGSLLRSVFMGNGSILDLDLDFDGTILAATGFNSVLITDTALGSYHTIPVPNWPYVAFAHPTPEPAGIALLLLGALAGRKGVGSR